MFCRAAAAAAVLLASQCAYGHSPFPGFKGFYTGLGHPFTEPAHLMGLIAAGLAIAGYAGRQAGSAMLAAVLAALVGMAASRWLADVYDPQLALIMATALLAAIVAAGRPLPGIVIIGVCAACAFLLGQDSLPDPGPVDQVVITSLGAWAAIAYLLAAAAGASRAALARWPGLPLQIGMRVLGSWLLAAAVLYLALAALT